MIWLSMIVRVLQYIAIFGHSIFYYHVYIFLFFSLSFLFFVFFVCWSASVTYDVLPSDKVVVVAHPPADHPTTIGVMNCYIPPTPSYSYVCVAHCLSWERSNPTVADQLSTTQPRTPLMLCTQIVYYQAPGLFSCRDTQYVHYPVPGLDLCDLLYSAWKSLAFPWSSLQSTDYTYYVCDVTKELVHMEYLTATSPVFLIKTPAGTIALFDASTSSCRESTHHQPSSHWQRLAIASTPSSELSDYIDEPHLAFRPSPTPILR